jgi:hypothetical protein
LARRKEEETTLTQEKVNSLKNIHLNKETGKQPSKIPQTRKCSKRRRKETKQPVK